MRLPWSNAERQSKIILKRFLLSYGSKTSVFCPMLRITVGAFCYAVAQQESVASPSATPVTHNGKLRSLLLSYGAKTVVFETSRQAFRPVVFNRLASSR